MVHSLQNIYENLWMLDKDTHKQELFMQFINKAKEWKILMLHRSMMGVRGGSDRYFLFHDKLIGQKEVYKLWVEIFNQSQAFPKIIDNQEKYRVATTSEQVVSCDKVKNKEVILKETPPTKVRLRTVCNKLILELIPQYIAIPKHKDGGFSEELYEEIKAQIEKMYPIQTSFTRNIFSEEWKKVIDGNKEKYGYLSDPGRRYNKEV